MFSNVVTRDTSQFEITPSNCVAPLNILEKETEAAGLVFKVQLANPLVPVTVVQL